MPLEKKPFRSYTLDEEKQKGKGRIITVRLTEEWLRFIDEDKKFLKQSKDSTVLKQLALIGHYVLHDDLTGKIVNIVLENRRKNKEVGLVDFD